MCNTCLRSGGGRLLGVGMVTYFLSMLGIKLGLREGSVGGTLVGLVVGETGVAVLIQEDVM